MSDKWDLPEEVGYREGCQLPKVQGPLRPLPQSRVGLDPGQDWESNGEWGVLRACVLLTPLQEEVGRWVAQQEKETRRLQRPGSERLFPMPGRGHKYAVEIRGQLNGSAGPGHSELTLLWDRTGVPGGSVSV